MPPWQVRIRQPAAIFISELTEIVRNGWVEEYFWELQNPYLEDRNIQGVKILLKMGIGIAPSIGARRDNCHLS